MEHDKWNWQRVGKMSDLLKPLSLCQTQCHCLEYTQLTTKKKTKQRESLTLQTSVLLFFQFHSEPLWMAVSCVAVCVLCGNVNHEGSNLAIPPLPVCVCVRWSECEREFTYDLICHYARPLLAEIKLALWPHQWCKQITFQHLHGDRGDLKQCSQHLSCDNRGIWDLTFGG